MRICYVCHANSHFIHPYTDYFSAQGHEVHVVSLHHANVPNVTNHHPLAREVDPELDKWAYVPAAYKVSALLRAIRPDIVHAHYLSSNGLLAAIANIHPLIVSARGSDVYLSMRSIFRRRLLKFVVNRADVVNSVARCLAKELGTLGARRKTSLVLSQGIRCDEFLVDRSPGMGGPVRIICTRTLNTKNHCGVIVQALEKLSRRGVSFRFIFAANGPELNSLKKAVVRANLTGSITFLEGYDLTSLPALLADSDIYASSSLWDGSSVSLLEAMASGLFPVISNIPGNDEWVRGDGDGLLFDPHNADDLAGCLDLAIESHDLRQNAIRVNRLRVRERGDRTTNMAVLGRIYEQLTASGS